MAYCRSLPTSNTPVNMKTFRLLSILFVSALLFTSCADVVEEIYLEEDGSGTYEVYTDVVSVAIDLATEMNMKLGAPADSTKTLDEDSIRAHATKEALEDYPNKLDSTYSYVDYGEDSIPPDDPEGYTKRALGFERGGREVGYVLHGMMFPFKSAKDLTGFLAFVEKSIAGDIELGLNALSGSKMNAKFKAKKKKFRRTTDPVKLKKLDEDKKSLLELMTVLDSSSFITIVHTKRKVIKVKGSNVDNIEDYKVTFKYDLKALVEGEVRTDFEIVME